MFAMCACCVFLCFRSGPHCIPDGPASRRQLAEDQSCIGRGVSCTLDEALAQPYDSHLEPAAHALTHLPPLSLPPFLTHMVCQSFKLFGSVRWCPARGGGEEDWISGEGVSYQEEGLSFFYDTLIHKRTPLWRERVLSLLLWIFLWTTEESRARGTSFCFTKSRVGPCSFWGNYLKNQILRLA